MTKALIKIIQWNEVHSGLSYLYGSQLKIIGDAMYFNNPRLASGKPIAKFVSRTNYQGNRRTPNLPLLIPNEKYTLESYISSQPEHRYFIQIDFFNRQNENIAFEIVREQCATFTCPEETFHYTISLFSAGCTNIIFKDIRLYQEKQQHVIKLNSTLKNSTHDSKQKQEKYTD